jgi:hypothetical protein
VVALVAGVPATEDIPAAPSAASSEKAGVACDEVVAAGIPGGGDVGAPAALAKDAATMKAAIVRCINDIS